MPLIGAGDSIRTSSRKRRPLVVDVSLRRATAGDRAGPGAGEPAPVWTMIASAAAASMCMPRIVAAGAAAVDANGMNGVFMSSDGGDRRASGEGGRRERVWREAAS
ncbi:MAG: hypothetical protein ABI868_12930 [Acidobacteriota bacterium]